MSILVVLPENENKRIFLLQPRFIFLLHFRKYYWKYHLGGLEVTLLRVSAFVVQQQIGIFYGSLTISIKNSYCIIVINPDKTWYCCLCVCVCSPLSLKPQTMLPEVRPGLLITTDSIFLEMPVLHSHSSWNVNSYVASSLLQEACSTPTSCKRQYWEVKWNVLALTY